MYAVQATFKILWEFGNHYGNFQTFPAGFLVNFGLFALKLGFYNHLYRISIAFLGTIFGFSVVLYL